MEGVLLAQSVVKTDKFHCCRIIMLMFAVSVVTTT
jgi:hypothetical protein